MSNGNGILIRNIFYMLLYVFNLDRVAKKRNVGAEAYENLEEMLIDLLCLAVSEKLRQGLYREYKGHIEDLSVIRGKINLKESIPLIAEHKQRLSCSYDEFSEDNMINQIIKGTLKTILLHAHFGAKGPDKVDSKYKVQVRNLLPFFANVSDIQIKRINWRQLSYSKFSITYAPLINVCRFILECKIFTEIGDDQTIDDWLKRIERYRLFEAFVATYIKRKFKGLVQVKAQSKLRWVLEEEFDDKAFPLMPVMCPDLIVIKGEKHLIIDTKFYQSVEEYQKYGDHEVAKWRNSHVSQVYAYGMNYKQLHPGDIKIMLLYAKPLKAKETPEIIPLKGLPFFVKLLDLNCDYKEINRQLDRIIEKYL